MGTLQGAEVCLGDVSALVQQHRDGCGVTLQYFYLRGPLAAVADPWMTF